MLGLYQHNGSAFDFSHANVSPALLSGPDAHQLSGIEEMCTPKYFVFNSQVR